jgi:chromosome segregation ATPase
MTSLMKTMIWAGVALVGLTTFVFGKDAWNYVVNGTKAVRENVQDAVKSEIPIEFEVQRAREMVEDLVPDIRKCMHVIAEQQVDVEARHDEIASRETALDEQRDAILALRSDLESGKTQFVYKKRVYSEDEVRRDLATRFERFKIAEETLDRDRQIAAAREKALAANEEKLAGMLRAKQDLEVRIEQLEARVKSVRAAETVSNLEIDDSQLSRAKSLIRELNKQLDVKERLMDAEGKFSGLIPVEAGARDVPEDIESRVDEYFAPKADPAL